MCICTLHMQASVHRQRLSSIERFFGVCVGMSGSITSATRIPASGDTCIADQVEYRYTRAYSFALPEERRERERRRTVVFVRERIPYSI